MSPIVIEAESAADFDDEIQSAVKEPTNSG